MSGKALAAGDFRHDRRLAPCRSQVLSNRSGGEPEFRNEFERLVLEIRMRPRQFPKYKKTGLRHMILRKFPFVVFYREAGDSVVIYAIAHGRRQPDYWKDRLED